jgi:hypothetical protein
MTTVAIERTDAHPVIQQGQGGVVNDCVDMLFGVAKHLATYGTADAMDRWFFLYALHAPLDSSVDCKSAVEQLRQHAARMVRKTSVQDCAAVHGAYEDWATARLADGSLSSTDYTVLPFAWPRAT